MKENKKEVTKFSHGNSYQAGQNTPVNVYGGYPEGIRYSQPYENRIPPVGNYVQQPPYGVHCNPIYGDQNLSPRDTRQKSEKTIYNVGRLNTKRSGWKMLFLGIITLGFYNVFQMYRIACDINLICHKEDGKRTMSFWLLCLISPFLLGIPVLVWMHKLSNRIGDALIRRRIDYKFNAATFWLWDILGVLILVGPLVYACKLCKAMNLLSEHYNCN